MRGQFKLIVISTFFLIFLLTAFNPILQKNTPLKSFFSYFAYPILFVNHKIKSFCEAHSWSLSDQYLKEQNSQLQGLVANLLSQNVTLLAQSKYWQDNQELIEFSKRYCFERAILSQTFFKHLSPEEQYMLFDKGSCDGVKLHMVAIYKNNILGKVVAVYPHYCQVDLVSSKNCKIAVYDANTGAVGICVGTNDYKRVEINYVSHLQQIRVGDLLISSGDGETFPAGFGVGQVTNVCEDGMYYQVKADLMLDLLTVNSCYLIADNKS